MGYKASQGLFSLPFLASCSTGLLWLTVFPAFWSPCFSLKFPGILLPLGLCIHSSLSLQGTSLIYPCDLLLHLLKLFAQMPHSQWCFFWSLYLVLQPPSWPTLPILFVWFMFSKKFCEMPICHTTFMTFIYYFLPFLE